MPIVLGALDKARTEEMAGTNSNNHQFNNPNYLDQSQQDLLLAALASNNSSLKGSSFQSNGQMDPMAQNAQGQPQQFFDQMNNPYFPSQPAAPLTNFDAYPIDDSPFIEGLDGEANFDFDFENGGQMIGSLPDGSPEAETPEADLHDKRKIDDRDEGNGDNKRREGENREAKKPGRKPLTSEPTSKRKAQNRAAQRAFRERKEKHLKDLETKVEELEKASEAANHENGLLKAQVQRLQMELREYRKRLSLNSSGAARPTSLSNGFSSPFAGLSGGSLSNNFQFEFPKFGGLPGNHILNGALAAKNASPKPSVSNSAPGVLARTGSVGRSVSPKSAMNGATQKRTTSADNVTGLYSPPTANGAKQDNKSNRGSETSGSRSHANSNPSNSASPTDSSISQYGANSSCGTTPEPSHNSPKSKNNEINLDTVNEHGYVCHGNSEGEITFCEKLNMACGNPRNPIPRTMSQSGQSNAGTPAPTTAAAKTPDPAAATAANPTDVNNVNGIDWLANQNGGGFDPVLFGDYRDSNAAIVGEGDFTGGFFNEAFNGVPDFGSPFSLEGLTPAPATANKPNPMDEVEKLQQGIEDGDDDEVVPGDDMSQMLSCHKIWDKLQEQPDFKEGNFDIDGLCSELRSKARCSESGVVVDQRDVDEALKRLPRKSSQAQSPGQMA